MKLARPTPEPEHAAGAATRATPFQSPDCAVLGSKSSENSKSTRRARKQRATIEEDLLATCGGLLGSVEALACELPVVPPLRTARALQDARYFGQRLRDQLEALAILALPELSESAAPVSFSVARWLDHACRGAAAQLAESQSHVIWPSLDELGDLSVLLTVSRMDRAFTVMLEQLAAAAGPGAAVLVAVTHGADRVTLTLSAQPSSTSVNADDVGGSPRDGQTVSALFLRAWERLCHWQQGAFRYNPETLAIVCELPRTSGLP